MKNDKKIKFSNHSEPKTMTILCPLDSSCCSTMNNQKKKSPTCSITYGPKIKLCQGLDAKNGSQKLTGNKHNDIRQAAELNPSGLQSLQADQSKRCFQTIETNHLTFLYNSLPMEMTWEKIYLHTNLTFKKKPNLFLPGNFTLLILFPCRPLHSQASFQTASIPLLPFLSCWNTPTDNISLVKGATVYCRPQESLC